MADQPLSFHADQAGTLLPFLLERVKGKSRNNVKSMLARGQVAVDGNTATRFDCPLAPGQTVTVALGAAMGPKLPFPILFEDGEIIVIDKPAGLLSIATDEEKEATVYHMLTDYVRTKDKQNRIFVVHRLDRDTSGVLLFARTEALKRAFQEHWDETVTVRGYMAVVEGVPEEPTGTVKSYLHETPSHLVYSGGSFGGREAVTHYELLRGSRKYSLLNVRLDTGRKNQIRVHMKDLGCPVAGDKKYGARTNPLGRLALHAHRLALTHPLTGAELSFTARIPQTFESLLRR